MPIQTAFTMVMFYSMVLFLPAAALALWRWPRAWALLLALYLGWLVSLMDLRSDDPQGTVLLLVTLGLFIGFARPAGAWRWALALGVWVPSVGAVAGASGVTAPAAGDVLFSALALVPAFVGVYLGVFVRRASARFEKAETH